MQHPPKTPATRRSAAKGAARAFTGRNLALSQNLDPKQFFWDQYNEIIDRGLSPSAEVVVRIAKFWGVPLSLKYGKELVAEFADYCAESEERDRQIRPKPEFSEPPGWSIVPTLTEAVDSEPYRYA